MFYFSLKRCPNSVSDSDCFFYLKRTVASVSVVFRHQWLLSTSRFIIVLMSVFPGYYGSQHFLKYHFSANHDLAQMPSWDFFSLHQLYTFLCFLPTSVCSHHNWHISDTLKQVASFWSTSLSHLGLLLTSLNSCLTMFTHTSMPNLCLSPCP